MAINTVLLALVLVLLAMVFEKWRQSRSRSTVNKSRLPPIVAANDPTTFSWLWGHITFLTKVRKQPGGNELLALELLTQMSEKAIGAVHLLPPWLGFAPLYLVRGERETKVILGKLDPSMVNTREAGKLIVGQQYAQSLKDPTRRKQQLTRLSSGLRRAKNLQTLVRMTAKHVRQIEFLQLGEDAKQETKLLEKPMFHFNRLVTSAMAEFMGGVDLSSPSITQAEKEKFFVASIGVSEYFGNCIQSAVTPITRIFLYPLEYITMRRNVAYLVNKWYLPAAEARQRLLEDGDDTVPDDMLTAMLDENAASSSGPALDCKLSANIANAFLETADSVTGAMQWVLLHMSQSPEAQEKCYSEIAALASRTDGDDFLTYESVEAMRYLAACIKEAIRLTSPSKFVSRETAVDYDIGDLTLPRGAVLLVNMQSKQVSEENFENSKDYRPERWIDDPLSGGSKAGRDALAYAPFGFGASRCFGEANAMAILKTTLALVLLKYRFELVSSPEEAYATFPMFTFVPNNMVIRFIPRKS